MTGRARPRNAPRQLSFDLPVIPALGRDDFLVSPGNAIAVATIESASPWAGGKLVLCGPTGSGKSHLTHVWAARSGATIRAAGDLCDADVPALARGPVAVEDVPGIAADPGAQRSLFHLHNLMLAQGHALLLSGRNAPARWDLSLADLQSRMMGAHVVTLAPPDDALLAAVLAKLFYDRQITPKPDVIPYLVRHMERSFAAAATLVGQLDRAAMAQSCAISRPLAVRVIADQVRTQ